MKYPNFLIVGAPKCGTTSLARYLSEHERVFVTEPKEPHYFNRHLITMPAFRDVPSFRNSWEHYLALFEGADDRHLAVGEASTRSALDDRAMSRIAEAFPEARILVLFRNPVELVYSMHGEQVFQATEPVRDFEEAWDLQEARAQGRERPASAGYSDLLTYRQHGQLADHLARIERVFPRERILVLFFDDLKADPRRVYRETLQFLEVPDDGRTEFPVHNASKGTRFPMLMRLLKGARSVRLLSARIKDALGIRSWGFFRAVETLNQADATRSPLSASMHNRLVDEFAEQVRRLSAMTGRDLNHWLVRRPEIDEESPNVANPTSTATTTPASSSRIS